MSDRISMAELMRMEFPPLEYVVPGVVPEGFTLLVAPPKVGKSWLVLDLAYALASGGKALGAIPIGRSRPVLYLALEDGRRRLQDRLNILKVSSHPRGLHLQTSIERSQVIIECQAFMDEHADDSPVIFIDTLGKVAPPANAGESDYMRDYRIGGMLKAVADSVTGGSVVVVHHTRKATSDDFLDAVSGTQGLAGSADSILVLKRDRNENNGTLSVTSRDATEGEYAVHREGAKWTLAAGDLTSAALALVNKRKTEGVGHKLAAVIELVASRADGIRAADVATALAMSEKDAGTYLLRAYRAERINRRERGLYVSVGSVESVGTVIAFPTQPTLPTPLQKDDEDDPGCCTHGVTIGKRCTRCGGTAAPDA